MADVPPAAAPPSADADPAAAARAAARNELDTLLFGNFPAKLDMAALERTIFYGAPSNGYRALAWKVFIGYLPPETAAWAEVLAEQREAYWGFAREFELAPQPRWAPSSGYVGEPVEWPPPRNINPDDPDFAAREIARRVFNDVERTCPESPFYQAGPPDAEVRPQDRKLQRMLYTYARLNPGIGYIQGMSELIAVLFYTFSQPAPHLSEPAPHEADELSRLRPLLGDDPEADAFWCLTELFSAIRDSFNREMDSADSGVMNDMIHLNNMLKVNDETLWAALEDKGVDHRFYSFRWLTLLLSQEFPLDQVLRLWDSLLADPFRFTKKWFLYHFSAAMLLMLRSQLLALEFNAIVPLLQSYPPELGVETLFPLALAVRKGRYAAPDSYNHQRLMEGTLYHRVSADEWLLQFFLLKRSRAQPCLRLLRYDVDPRFTQVSSLVLDSNRFRVEDVDPRDGASLLAGMHVFVLVQGPKRFFFAAPSQQVKWQWMAALSRAGSQDKLGLSAAESSSPTLVHASTMMVDYIDAGAYASASHGAAIVDPDAPIPIDEQIHSNVCTANDWFELAQNSPKRISLAPPRNEPEPEPEPGSDAAPPSSATPSAAAALTSRLRGWLPFSQPSRGHV
ncbi:uncharacterized protein AMSG_12198 [Thecamonas trahens ATCC 50062]|uniref:TBC1 domain family member 13 n=1 Tax=Thecamonas trahens ATCC 50062 TaxID=461836 RepID=A0A0L0DMM7_THETB|nr:hypothetical protein AMSG_12198 [Thecamonas trahens ATCC 50062]KNC53286.1 hypothetical protein AMSG_12198 [Thecamonas trahens ATCC 50062]|eukprot:XP_013754597.1 hypothetical protein AMSG_12198 [Thecamonas trahens ATCC 50062]